MIKLGSTYYLTMPRYVPGDLIKFKGEYHSILASDEHKVCIWYRPKVTYKGKELWVRNDDVTPIPITEQFLIENHWSRTKQDGNGNYAFIRNNIIIVIDVLKDNFYYLGIRGKIKLSYISDLQHLLFGLKFSDNFY